MGLTDRELKVVELYAQGAPITEIAKVCGVSRQTIYNDLDKEQVKVAVDEAITEIKTQAEKKVTSKIDNYIDKLEEIAFAGSSEKVRADALQYLINRALGTPTSKVQDISDDKENGNKVDTEQINEEFNKFRAVK